MRELITFPNKLLRQKSKPVKNIDSEIKALAEEMIQFMRLHRGDKFLPVGLAAPQLGELLRVIAFTQNPRQDNIQVLINPELVYEKGRHLVLEGCLSLPGKVFTLKRAKIVKIRGLTLDGVVRSFHGRDLLAQIFTHELGHLDGLLIDKIGEK